MLRAFAIDPIGTVSIEEMSTAGLLKLSTRTYWRRVWPAGVSLASYIVERFGTEGLRDRDVLDLGCGVGLVGIVCGRLGARVTFLDREAGALAAVPATAAATASPPPAPSAATGTTAATGSSRKPMTWSSAATWSTTTWSGPPSAPR